MFTDCHFAILFLKEHKISEILIFIGRLFHILFPRNLRDFRPQVTLEHLGTFVLIGSLKVVWLTKNHDGVMLNKKNTFSEHTKDDSNDNI